MTFPLHSIPTRKGEPHTNLVGLPEENRVSYLWFLITKCRSHHKYAMARIARALNNDSGSLSFTPVELDLVEGVGPVLVELEELVCEAAVV